MITTTPQTPVLNPEVQPLVPLLPEAQMHANVATRVMRLGRAAYSALQERVGSALMQANEDRDAGKATGLDKVRLAQGLFNTATMVGGVYLAHRYGIAFNAPSGGSGALDHIGNGSGIQQTTGEVDGTVDLSGHVEKAAFHADSNGGTGTSSPTSTETGSPSASATASSTESASASPTSRSTSPLPTGASSVTPTGTPSASGSPLPTGGSTGGNQAGNGNYDPITGQNRGTAGTETGNDSGNADTSGDNSNDTQDLTNEEQAAYEEADKIIAHVTGDAFVDALDDHNVDSGDGLIVTFNDKEVGGDAIDNHSATALADILNDDGASKKTLTVGEDAIGYKMHGNQIGLRDAGDISEEQATSVGKAMDQHFLDNDGNVSAKARDDLAERLVGHKIGESNDNTPAQGDADNNTSDTNADKESDAPTAEQLDAFNKEYEATAEALTSDATAKDFADMDVPHGGGALEAVKDLDIDAVDGKKGAEADLRHAIVDQMYDDKGAREAFTAKVDGDRVFYTHNGEIRISHPGEQGDHPQFQDGMNEIFYTENDKGATVLDMQAKLEIAKAAFDGAKLELDDDGDVVVKKAA